MDLHVCTFPSVHSFHQKKPEGFFQLEAYGCLLFNAPPLGSVAPHGPRQPDFTKLAFPIKMNLPTSVERVHGLDSAKGHT